MTGDVPMSRVKMNAKMEYEYLENFKILQKAFVKHRIDKVCRRWCKSLGAGLLTRSPYPSSVSSSRCRVGGARMVHCCWGAFIPEAVQGG